MDMEGRVQGPNEPQARHDQRLQPAAKPRKFTALHIIVAIAIFFFGIGIGNGKIKLFNSTRNSANSELPVALDYSSVNEVYQALRGNYDGKLDISKLNNGLKEGLAKASGDPYTEYLDPEEYKEFGEGLSGSFTGIGAELSKDSKTNTIQIVAPIAGFPAEKAGLKPKDVIAEINGESAYDLSVSEAVKKIRGPKDTTVKLKVIRDGSQALDLEIKRDNINIPSVEPKIENGIGYLKISRFGDDTNRLTREAANNFKQNNVRGVVLDMRSNPGGLLDSAVEVSSLWLPAGKTILTERRDNVVVRTFNAKGNPVLNGIPTAVLIDEGSASASEIVAGALKDNGAATLIGEKTFGKGSVQQLAKLRDGSMLKVTIARWFTPSGKNIDKEGIQPDKKVEITDDDAKNQRDSQKDAAIAEVSK